MSPVFADSFFYLALLNPADAAHDAAERLSLGLHVPVVTTAWVLAEVANTMAAQRRSFLLLYENLRNDRNVAIVPPTEESFGEGLAFYARHQDKDWSLTDCISFLVMRERRVTDALTGDHHFEQAGFRAMLK
jgi:uncharacterized protein